jgi:hypothetical protein
MRQSAVLDAFSSTTSVAPLLFCQYLGSDPGFLPAGPDIRTRHAGGAGMRIPGLLGMLRGVD